MKLPDFLCVGAAKAGSTTIHDVLDLHPEILLPASKELHFFDNDENYAKGSAWYESQFFEVEPGQITGEITPAYMSYEKVPARIHETLGDNVKLVFSLREPVARAYSEFHHNRRRGFFEGEFEDAIKWEFEKSDLSQWDRRKYSFISRGFYVRQIQRFLEIFPRENMFFIVMEEDLGERSDETFETLLHFLGVENCDIEAIRQSNKAYEPRSMMAQRFLYNDNSVRRWARSLIRSRRLRKKFRRLLLRLNTKRQPPQLLSAETIASVQDEYYRDEIRDLERLLHRDLSVWRSTTGLTGSE